MFPRCLMQIPFYSLAKTDQVYFPKKKFAEPLCVYYCVILSVQMSVHNATTLLLSKGWCEIFYSVQNHPCLPIALQILVHWYFLFTSLESKSCFLSPFQVSQVGYLNSNNIGKKTKISIIFKHRLYIRKNNQKLTILS